MEWYYYFILIENLVERARRICIEELELYEIALELDDVDADLDEIGAFLDAAGV